MKTSSDVNPHHAEGALALPGRESAVRSPGVALESLPPWLRSDVSENGRSVCIDGCGVGRDLPTVARVFGSVPLWGIDPSEEAIVEARRRYPDFRFKVASAELQKQWDLVVHLEASPARTRLLAELERLCGMARRAVVVTLPSGTLDPHELPIVVGERFVLTGCSVTGDLQRWLVATWALVELPQVRLLSVGEALPAMFDERAGVGRRPPVERLQADLAQVRSRLADAQRESLATRELLAEKQAELEHLAREVDGLRVQDAELREELADIQASRSWQLTRPMRQVVGNLRKARDQARDLAVLANRVTRDVAQGRARDWIKLASQAEDREKTRQPRNIPVVPAVAASRPLFAPTVYMFALVPFDDVGGGQRSAQLARVMAARGYNVVYVYLYKKWNVVLGGEEESHVELPLLTHLHISQVDPETLLRGAAPDSVAIFEVPHPKYEALFQRARQIGIRTVFELIDAWDTSLGGDWYKPELMRAFSLESDVAVGTARALVRSLERQGRSDALYLPNAGNEAIFDGHRQFERPPEIDGSRRAFVYVGSLYGEWFGWDHVRAAARLCTDAVFYLIGDPPKGLDLPANVRLLGPRKIDEVPAYLAAADAALLPFVPGRISDAVSPIKIFEYLLMGKRVISTDLPEIRDYPNTTVTSSPDDFARACRGLEAPEAPPEAFIMRNTWSARADALLPPMRGPRVTAVLLTRGGLFEAERCVESLALHGVGHIADVICIAATADQTRAEVLTRFWPGLRCVVGEPSTIGDAWALVRQDVSTEAVLFIDERFWLTSRAGIEEALQILGSEASIGCVGSSARFLDPDTGRADEASPGWLNDQRGSSGFRRDVAYLSARGLFVRRRVLDRVVAGAIEGGELEGAEVSFRVRASGLDLAARSLTGLRTADEGAPVIPSEQREAFLSRWKGNRNFFVTRRGV